MFITRAGALPNLSLEDYLRGGYLLAAGGVSILLYLHACPFLKSY